MFIWETGFRGECQGWSPGHKKPEKVTGKKVWEGGGGCGVCCATEIRRKREQQSQMEPNKYVFSQPNLVNAQQGRVF